MGLCLEPDEASTAQLQEIEQHLVRALTALSLSEPKVFGKFLTETDVKPLPIVPENEPAGWLVPQAEDGLGASPHVGAQSGGAGGARQPRRQGPVRAAPNMADVQPVRPTARSDGSAAQNLRGRRSRVPLLEHAQELAAGGPAGAHVEVPGEVRALGVAQEDPALERQALAGGVGDGVAQPGVLQEGGVGEGLATVQHHFFGPHFGHVHVDALADPATGPDELQAEACWWSSGRCRCTRS